MQVALGIVLFEETEGELGETMRTFCLSWFVLFPLPAHVHAEYSKQRALADISETVRSYRDYSETVRSSRVRARLVTRNY